MFAYCLNNPVNKSDLAGTSALSCFSIKDSGKNRTIIKYNVINYTQEGKTCWAYCQTMIEFYYDGIGEDAVAASKRAKDIYAEVYGDTEFDKGGWPTNLGKKTMVYSIEELFYVLCESGPLYAYYSSGDNAHMVVVTGVNLETQVVYSNNPWGVHGLQSFDGFLAGVYVEEGLDDLGMTFVSLYYVKK